MDTTKETYPNPLNNHFGERGMHVLVLDGPGQGESWLRGILSMAIHQFTTHRREIGRPQPGSADEKLLLQEEIFGCQRFRAARSEKFGNGDFE